MSKLFTLKEWLTIEETATHLTTILGERVLELDVFRLVLNGFLKLSVRFFEPVAGNTGEVVGSDGVEWWIDPDVCPFKKATWEDAEKYDLTMKSLSFDNEVYINLNLDERDVESIDGVWDLMMIGGESIEVSRQCQRLLGLAVNECDYHFDGIFVQRAGVVCRLLKYSDSKARSPGYKENPHGYRLPDYIVADSFPEQSIFVVKSSEIIEFLRSIESGSNKEEKPLSTKERYSLLVLIAALCKQLNLDWKAKGISGAIAKATEEIGTPVTDDTIRKILNQIDEAITSRSK